MRARGHRVVLTLLVSAAIAVAASAAQRGQRPAGPPEPQRPRPARDTDRRAPEAGTSTISGRVILADTGSPVRRARVMATGARRPHIVLTDDAGHYQLTGLTAGTYNLTASKPGLVDAAFGQRRPAGPGTPLQVADGQHLTRADIHMPRGGVITGHVRDDAGEAVARARVAVQRYTYLRGERQLTSAGTDETDDRGQFRVYGLPPGEYLVSATLGVERIGFRSFGPARMRGRGGPPGPVAEQRPITGYAPTYYPGTTVPTAAAPLKLAPSQELGGVDFQLQLVPLATVRGTVASADGVVFLVPDRGRGVRAQSTRTTVRDDNTFAITDVAPGNYTLVARTDGPDGTNRIAVQPIAVTGEDVMATLVPVPGVSLRGTVTFETAGSPTPLTFEGFRVSAQPVNPLPAIPRMGRPARVAAAGSFTLADLLPGQYVIQATGGRGWRMKAVYLGGREVTDEVLDIASEAPASLNVIFTDRTTSLNGAVRDTRSAGVPGVTVIAFPADATLWRPQTRRIQTTRTDQNGDYRIGHVPPGEYLVAVVEDVEQGEWFDPDYLNRLSSQATRLSIGEGEQKRLDLTFP